MKKHKQKVYIGWVTDKKIYSYFKARGEYLCTGEVIYKKKRFDTPHKIKITIKDIK